MSLSDGGVQATMPVAPVNSSNGNGFGWGGDGAWWIVLFLIFRRQIMAGVSRGGTKG